jgi:hypothetical protein
MDTTPSERYSSGSLSMLIITLPSFGGVDLISLSFVLGCTSKVNDSCIATLVHQAGLVERNPHQPTWTINGNIKKHKEMVHSHIQIARDVLESMPINYP